MNQARVSAALLCLLLMSGCFSAAPIPDLPEDAPADFPLDRYRATGPARVLQIESSHLQLLVYRGGRLKHLGHNHVITSNALQGLILEAADGSLRNSYADLYLPLASLVVDDPAARSAAGPDFSSTPSEADRRGTLGNLLGPKLLDAAAFPYVRMAIRLSSSSRADIALLVKNKEIALEVPIHLERTGPGLEVNASFEVTHAQLGLAPFTALGGAIAVADPIRISISLSAEVSNRHRPIL